MTNKNNQYAAGKLKFWVSCPKCGQKFGVEPKFIIKYLERLINHHKIRLNGMQDMLQAVQKEIEEINKGEKRA